MLTYIKAQPNVFEPEEILILVGAFDKAWQSVLATGAEFDGNAESIRAILAKHIIESASRGKFNQKRLCRAALDHLAVSLPDAPRPPRAKR
jgi:hypothetical protein